VGPRAGLDTEDRGKILCPCRGSHPERNILLCNTTAAYNDDDYDDDNNNNNNNYYYY
jgi:hypothetical protein